MERKSGPNLVASKLAWLVVVAAFSVSALRAQDLAPRAYVITPVDLSVVNLTYSYFTGSLALNGVVPVTGATGTYSVPIFSYYYSLNFLGRSANFNASLPYAVGTFQGNVAGVDTRLYRSGLLDSSFRFSVNLKGGPAMHAPEFAKWQQDVLMGLSLKVIAPTGQYDPNRLINWGANRWSVKPEFGYSERWGKWVLDGYAGVWFNSTNPQFYSPPQPLPQSMAPIGSLEGHLSYDVKSRFWFSFDGNFWFGGAAALNGIVNPATHQTSSRIGATGAIPFTSHQSVKISYSSGAYARFGGNYQNVAVSWQYAWIGRPR